MPLPILIYESEKQVIFTVIDILVLSCQCQSVIWSLKKIKCCKCKNWKQFISYVGCLCTCNNFRCGQIHHLLKYSAIVGMSSNDSSRPKDITLHSCSLYRPGVLARELTKRLCKWLLLQRPILLPRLGQQYFINTVFAWLQVGWDEDLLMFYTETEKQTLRMSSYCNFDIKYDYTLICLASAQTNNNEKKKHSVTFKKEMSAFSEVPRLVDEQLKGFFFYGKKTLFYSMVDHSCRLMQRWSWQCEAELQLSVHWWRTTGGLWVLSDSLPLSAAPFTFYRINHPNFLCMLRLDLHQENF